MMTKAFRQLMPIHKLFGKSLIILSTCLSAGCGSHTTSTTNAAAPWQLVGINLSYPNVILNSLLISDTGVIYAGGSIDMYNGGIESLVVGSTGSWQLIGGGFLPNPEIPDYGTNIVQVKAIARSASNAIYAAINLNYLASNVYVFEDNTWYSITGTLIPNKEVINSLVIDENDTVYAATSAYDATNNVYVGNVYRGGNDGGDWQLLGGGSMPDGGVANALIYADKILYVAAGGPNVKLKNAYIGDVYSSTFSAGNWGNWSQVGGDSMPDGGVPGALALAGIKESEVLYVATSKGNVYTISPRKNRWSLVGKTSMPDGSAINSLAAAESNAQQVIYAATAQGNVYGCIASQNGSWQQLGTGPAPDGWFINSVATYHNQIYIVTQGGNTYMAKSFFD